MDAFTKELNILLQKYPDLPEFTITVRPRLTIEPVKQKIVIPPIGIHDPDRMEKVKESYDKVFKDPTDLVVDVASKIKNLGLKEIVQ